MKYLILILSLIFISAYGFTQNSPVQEIGEYDLDCYIQNDIQLIACLLDLTPEIKSIKIRQDNYARPNIEALNQYLPQNKQLEKIYFFFIDIQSPEPLYTCLQGLTNIHTLVIDFSRLSVFDVNKFETMFQDQYQSLVDFTFIASCITQDIKPFANVIYNLVNVESFKFVAEPEKYYTQNPVIKNLSSLKGGLFKNCKNLKNLDVTFLNTDWSKKQVQGFSQVFQNVPTLENLIFQLKQSQLEDIEFLSDTFAPLNNQLNTLGINLSYNPISTFEPLQQVFDNQSKIEIVQFVADQFYQKDFTPTQEYFESIGPLFQNLKSLKDFEFSINSLGASQLKFSTLQNTFSIPSLETLNFQFSDNSVASLKDFENTASQNDNLTYLSIDFNNNKIQNLQQLGEFIENFQQISSLDISLKQNKIQNIDNLIQDLSILNNLTTLTINIDNNCLEQDEQYYIDAINQSLPNLQQLSFDLGFQGSYICENNNIKIIE